MGRLARFSFVRSLPGFGSGHAKTLPKREPRLQTGGSGHCVSLAECRLEQRHGLIKSKVCRTPIAGSAGNDGRTRGGRPRSYRFARRGCDPSRFAAPPPRAVKMCACRRSDRRWQAPRPFPCMPPSSRPARTTRIYKRRGEIMLSDFPRLGFDPFAELRRMQSEMNRLFAGLPRRPRATFRCSTSGRAKTALWSLQSWRV